jgi:hypothetical protein
MFNFATIIRLDAANNPILAEQISSTKQLQIPECAKLLQKTQVQDYKGGQ